MANWQAGSSVRRNLIALIGLILIAGFATSSVISYQVSKASLREALIGNELPLTSDNIYSEIQRDLLRPVFVASMMAAGTMNAVQGAWTLVPATLVMVFVAISQKRRSAEKA